MVEQELPKLKTGVRFPSSAPSYRVPWPMEPERKRVELLEAKEDFDRARGQMEPARRLIARGKEVVENAQKALARISRRDAPVHGEKYGLAVSGGSARK